MFIFILLIKQLSRAEKGIKKAFRGIYLVPLKMETNCLMVYDGSNLSPVLGRNLNLVEIRFTHAFFDVNGRRSVIC